MSFDLGRASVTGDLFFNRARNIIATVLASSGMATTIETVFVTEINGGAILKILANSWNVFNSWHFTVDKYTSVSIASVFRSPFVSDWVFKTVVFTELFGTVRVADATGVSFALVFSFVGWGTSQVVATWAAHWSLFNALITEVTHDDAAFAGALSGQTFDVVVEDHFTGFHDSSLVIASGGRVALFHTWKFKALGGVASAAFSSSSGDFVGLAGWAHWWVVNAERLVALALELWAAAIVFVVTDRFEFNEFLTLSGASWDSEQSTFISQIWNVFSASRS